jgi:hypothetical protein
MSKFDKITALFFREEGFYPVVFSGTKDPIEEVADHAKLNPGTLRIETVGGEVLWSGELQ